MRAALRLLAYAALASACSGEPAPAPSAPAAPPSRGSPPAPIAGDTAVLEVSGVT